MGVGLGGMYGEGVEFKSVFQISVLNGGRGVSRQLTGLSGFQMDSVPYRVML